MKKLIVSACLVIVLCAPSIASAQPVFLPQGPGVIPQGPMVAPPVLTRGPVFWPGPVLTPPAPIYRPQVYRPQVPTDVTPPKIEAASQPVSLSGPRFGMTFLGQEVVDKLATERNLTVAPVVSQFGWQFEKRMYANKEGLAALTEGVFLLGGLEQGVALPSFNWLVGLRTPGGSEFGVGPNVTPLGVGLVIAAGATFKTGALNIPVNLAVVPSKDGVRVSFLTGFNFRNR